MIADQAELEHRLLEAEHLVEELRRDLGNARRQLERIRDALSDVDDTRALELARGAVLIPFDRSRP